MLNKDFEKAYISSFVKIFTILKKDYEVYVKPGKLENYEIEIRKVGNEKIDNYLSICFQKQNGTLSVISSKKVDNKIIKKLIKDIYLALNKEPFAKYNLNKDEIYITYSFCYLDENELTNNIEILKKLENNDEISNVNFNI